MNPSGTSPTVLSERVSCIVSTFNNAAHVGAAIDSVLGQTRRPDEVLVVDPGSEDETREIAARYGDPVRVVEIPNESPSATRNRGIRESTGELIAFIDGDDLWHPEKLERQIAHLRRNPAHGGCNSHVQNFWDSELASEQEYFDGHRRAAPIPGFATTCLLARRDAFDRVGPLDEQLWFADSVDWFMRARRRGVEIEMLDDVLTYHRIRDGSITKRFDGASRAEFLQVIRNARADG